MKYGKLNYYGIHTLHSSLCKPQILYTAQQNVSQLRLFSLGWIWLAVHYNKCIINRQCAQF